MRAPTKLLTASPEAGFETAADITDDALAALTAQNDPPQVFQRSELLTRVRVLEDTGSAVLEPMTAKAVRGLLARMANWYKRKDTRDANQFEDDAPPLDAIWDLLALPAWTGIPFIDAVVDTYVSGEPVLEYSC